MPIEQLQPTTCEPHAPDAPIGLGELGELGELDVGTMEAPIDGTLAGSQPRMLEPVAGVPPRWVAWLAIPASAFAVALMAGLTHGSPTGVPTAVAPEPTEATLLSDAFEDELTIVRHAPTSPSGHAALLRAVDIAAELASAEATPGLWSERWSAAVDRHARYWPDDPMTPVLVHEAVAGLYERGHIEEAERLISSHLAP